jgi:hypothetical protein
MKTHKWLTHALIRISGPVRSHPGKHSAAPAHVRTAPRIVMMGFIILALVLGSAGVVTAAFSSHGSTGTHSVSTARTPQTPWMY